MTSGVTWLMYSDLASSVIIRLPPRVHSHGAVHASDLRRRHNALDVNAGQLIVHGRHRRPAADTLQDLTDIGL